MNVTCPHCHTRLNLPEDKLPRDRDSSFKCPKCKGSVQVKASRSSLSRSSEPQADVKSPPSAGTAGIHRRSSRAQVLVCMSSSQARNQIQTAIKRLGYLVEFPKNLSQAFKNLEYNTYPLVVVDDAFDRERQMALYMNEMDMSLRRKICLVRVTSGEETGNAMAALHSSVNAVVRIRDLEQEDDLYIEDLLNAVLADHEKFYAIFNDSMKVAGKA